MKFLAKTPGTSNGAKYPASYLLTQKWVIFIVINLQNYVLGVFQVAPCTMRCVHGSNNEILFEWDPGSTCLVQRLWDPGGPSYTPRSRGSTNLEKLGKPKSYLDYIHLLKCDESISLTQPRKALLYRELQLPS